MASRILIDYVKNGLKKGVSLEKLRDIVRRKGYPEGDFKDAVKQAYSETKGKTNFNSGKILGIVLCLIVIAGLVYGAIFLVSNIKKPAEEKETSPFAEILATDSENLMYFLLNKDIRWVATAVSCEAFLAKDTGNCDLIKDSISNQWCLEDYKDLSYLTETASLLDKDCSAYKGQELLNGSFNEDACLALKKDSCEGLTGKPETFCKALLEDVSLCTQVSAGGDCEKDFILGRAIIRKNPDLCKNERFNLAETEACKGVIKGDCSRLFESLTYDLSTANYARNSNNVSACLHVKNDVLRAACSNEEISYKDIYNIVNGNQEFLH